MEWSASLEGIQGETVCDWLLAGFNGIVGLDLCHQFVAFPEFHCTQADRVIATGGDDGEFVGAVSRNLSSYLEAPVGEFGLDAQRFPVKYMLAIGLICRVVGGEVERKGVAAG